MQNSNSGVVITFTISNLLTYGSHSADYIGYIDNVKLLESSRLFTGMHRQSLQPLVVHLAVLCSLDHIAQCPLSLYMHEIMSVYLELEPDHDHYKLGGTLAALYQSCTDSDYLNYSPVHLLSITADMPLKRSGEFPCNATLLGITGLL